MSNDKEATKRRQNVSFNMSKDNTYNRNKKLILVAEISVIICFLCVTVVTSPFYTLDSIVCDKLYTQMNGVRHDIRIIAIDEETLEEYGNFSVWSREKSAELMEVLCADEDNAPIAIGMDILFTGVSYACLFLYQGRG